MPCGGQTEAGRRKAITYMMKPPNAITPAASRYVSQYLEQNFAETMDTERIYQEQRAAQAAGLRYLLPKSLHPGQSNISYMGGDPIGPDIQERYRQASAKRRNEQDYYSRHGQDVTAYQQTTFDSPHTGAYAYNLIAGDSPANVDGHIPHIYPRHHVQAYPARTREGARYRPEPFGVQFTGDPLQPTTKSSDLQHPFVHTTHQTAWLSSGVPPVQPWSSHTDRMLQ